MSLFQLNHRGHRLSKCAKVILRYHGTQHSRRICQLRSSGRYGVYIRLTKTGRAVIDTAAVRARERLDGKFVVHSNDDTLSAEDMALGYKQLQRVEEAWRTLKSGIRLRPVYPLDASSNMCSCQPECAGVAAGAGG